MLSPPLAPPPPASPISTVKQPVTMTPPCTVMSPIRAAGSPPTRTVNAPCTIMSIGPTQIAMSVIRACGIMQVSTVGMHGGMIGPPTCGTSPVTIGQVCMSVTLAAGWPMISFPSPRF